MPAMDRNKNTLNSSDNLHTYRLSFFSSSFSGLQLLPPTSTTTPVCWAELGAWGYLSWNTESNAWPRKTGEDSPLSKEIETDRERKHTHFSTPLFNLDEKHR